MLRGHPEVGEALLSVYERFARPRMNLYLSGIGLTRDNTEGLREEIRRRFKHQISCQIVNDCDSDDENDIRLDLDRTDQDGRYDGRML